MEKNFEERYKAIRLRTDWLEEKKKHDKEIESLRAELRGLESTYERLRTTRDSNMQEYASKKVQLEVAKDIWTHAEVALRERTALFEKEERELDEMRERVWGESGKLCAAVRECVVNHDSVRFLNEFSSSRETPDHAFEVDEIWNDVDNDPEVTRLRTEVAKLEVRVEQISKEMPRDRLKESLAELAALRRNFDTTRESQRLIEALAESHEQRMIIEREIEEIESKVEKKSVDDPLKFVQVGEECVGNVTKKYYPRYSRPNEEKFDGSKEAVTADGRNYSDGGQERDKKQKAKDWWKDYVRELENAQPKIEPDQFFSPVATIRTTNSIEETVDRKNVQTSKKKRRTSKPKSERRKVQRRIDEKWFLTPGTEKKALARESIDSETNTSQNVSETDSRFFYQKKSASHASELKSVGHSRGTE